MAEDYVVSPDVVIREMPFCGIVLDTRTFRVYRLSRQSLNSLRGVVEGVRSVGDYDSLFATEPPDANAPRAVLDALLKAGMVRPASSAPQSAPPDALGRGHYSTPSRGMPPSKRESGG